MRLNTFKIQPEAIGVRQERLFDIITHDVVSMSLVATKLAKIENNNFLARENHT
jgi:hypothetical protein